MRIGVSGQTGNVDRNTLMQANKVYHFVAIVVVLVVVGGGGFFIS